MNPKLKPIYPDPIAMAEKLSVERMSPAAIIRRVEEMFGVAPPRDDVAKMVRKHNRVKKGLDRSEIEGYYHKREIEIGSNALLRAIEREGLR